MIDKESSIMNDRFWRIEKSRFVLDYSAFALTRRQTSESYRMIIHAIREALRLFLWELGMDVNRQFEQRVNELATLLERTPENAKELLDEAVESCNGHSRQISDYNTAAWHAWRKKCRKVIEYLARAQTHRKTPCSMIRAAIRDEVKLFLWEPGMNCDQQRLEELASSLQRRPREAEKLLDDAENKCEGRRRQAID
jgi:hypothetical protein